MAIGIEVVPIWNRDMNAVTEGMKLPDNTPAAMAVNIQSVKCLSKNESLLFILSIRVLGCKAACCHLPLFRSKSKYTSGHLPVS
jgi:hypothetical protein